MELIRQHSLATLLDSFSENIKLRASNYSFAEKLLKAADNDNILKEMKTLSREVVLHTDMIKATNKDEKGKVYAFEVRVHSEGDQLVVTKKDPSQWEKFLRGDGKDVVRTILIESDSLPVIETKLAVYREFKQHVCSKNLFLQHVFEDYDEIAKFSALHKIDWFSNVVEKLSKSIPTDNIRSIVETAVDDTITQANVNYICFGVNIQDNLKYIGTVYDKSYTCFSEFTVKRLKGNLVENTLKKLAETIGSKISAEISKHIESKVKREFEKDLIELRIELTEEMFASLTLIVISAFTFVFSAWLGLILAVGTILYTFVMSVDVNSRDWRLKVADELYKKVLENKSAILRRILPEIERLCENTSTDLRSVVENVRTFRQKIQLVNQNSLIELWEKREIIKAKDRVLWKDHPAFIKCIAGHNKYGKEVVKVFLRGQKPEKIDEKENLRKCFKVSKEFELDLVYADTKSEELKTTNDEIRFNELRTKAIDEPTRKELSEIIQKHGDKMYARFSMIVGIGISRVRYVDGKVLEEPCICLYCLDKHFVPFGEKPLPDNIEGKPCDKREDLVMFGKCFSECKASDITIPEPGCSIGIPKVDSSGSVGFLVKSENPIYSLKRGFLTVSHVAIEHFAVLYKDKSLMSTHPLSKTQNFIVHPSWEDEKQNNIIIGEVVESFCGTYGLNGLDFALVKIYNQTQNEAQTFTVIDGDKLDIVPNMKVIKTGRSTGTTEGYLFQKNLSVRVDSSFLTWGWYTFYNCYGIVNENNGIFSKGGDSGAAVLLKENDGTLKPLGMTFAIMGSQTAVCRIDKIVDRLDLSIIGCIGQHPFWTEQNQ